MSWNSGLFIPSHQQYHTLAIDWSLQRILETVQHRCLLGWLARMVFFSLVRVQAAGGTSKRGKQSRCSPVPCKCPHYAPGITLGNSYESILLPQARRQNNTLCIESLPAIVTWHGLSPLIFTVIVWSVNILTPILEMRKLRPGKVSIQGLTGDKK